MKEHSKFDEISTLHLMIYKNMSSKMLQCINTKPPCLYKYSYNSFAAPPMPRVMPITQQNTNTCNSFTAPPVPRVMPITQQNTNTCNSFTAPPMPRVMPITQQNTNTHIIIVTSKLREHKPSKRCLIKFQLQKHIASIEHFYYNDVD